MFCVDLLILQLRTKRSNISFACYV